LPREVIDMRTVGIGVDFEAMAVVEREELADKMGSGVVVKIGGKIADMKEATPGFGGIGKRGKKMANPLG